MSPPDYVAKFKKHLILACFLAQVLMLLPIPGSSLSAHSSGPFDWLTQKYCWTCLITFLICQHGDVGQPFFDFSCLFINVCRDVFAPSHGDPLRVILLFWGGF